MMDGIIDIPHCATIAFSVTEFVPFLLQVPKTSEVAIPLALPPVMQGASCISKTFVLPDLGFVSISSSQAIFTLL